MCQVAIAVCTSIRHSSAARRYAATRRQPDLSSGCGVSGCSTVRFFLNNSRHQLSRSTLVCQGSGTIRVRTIGGVDWMQVRP